jgi:hypothetical protein
MQAVQPDTAALAMATICYLLAELLHLCRGYTQIKCIGDQDCASDISELFRQSEKLARPNPALLQVLTKQGFKVVRVIVSTLRNNTLRRKMQAQNNVCLKIQSETCPRQCLESGRMICPRRSELVESAMAQ